MPEAVKPPLSTGMLMAIKQVIHYLFPATKKTDNPAQFIRCLFPPDIDPWELLRIAQERAGTFEATLAEFIARQKRIDEAMEYLVSEIERIKAAGLYGNRNSRDSSPGPLPGRTAIEGSNNGTGVGAGQL